MSLRVCVLTMLLLLHLFRIVFVFAFAFSHFLADAILVPICSRTHLFVLLWQEINPLILRLRLSHTFTHAYV